jgi:hypothetical protein
VDKTGSLKTACCSFGTVDSACKTEAKQEENNDKLLPAVKVEEDCSSKVRTTESPLKTEMDVTRGCERTKNTVHGQKLTLSDKRPPALTFAFARAATAPVRDERSLHSPDEPKPSRRTGIFDDDEGPTVIFDEDSMQSMDYERNMLNQDFNCDTVDVLETVDEDDEDVL